MKTIEYQPSGFTPSPLNVMVGILSQLASLIWKGMRLGLVLFLALVTCSVLSHGADYLQVSRQKAVKRSADVTRNAVLPQQAPRLISQAAMPKPQVRADAGQDVSMLMRESRYFMSELGSMTRTLGRFGK